LLWQWLFRLAARAAIAAKRSGRTAIKMPDKLLAQYDRPFEALLEDGYRLIAQRGDFAKTVAMNAAVDTPADLSTHTEPPPDTAWRHTQIAVLRRAPAQPATADGQHDSRSETP
jgi:hypothetical protein